MHAGLSGATARGAPCPFDACSPLVALEKCAFDVETYASNEGGSSDGCAHIRVPTDPMQTVGALRAEISTRLEWIAFDIFARAKAGTGCTEFRLSDQDSLRYVVGQDESKFDISSHCVVLGVNNVILDNAVIVVRQRQEAKTTVLSHAGGGLPDAAEWVSYEDDHSSKAKLTQAIASDVRNFVTPICAMH